MSIREEVAMKLCELDRAYTLNFSYDKLSDNAKNVYRWQADQILSILKTEAEKVESPYKTALTIEGRYSQASKEIIGWEADGFEQFRQDILAKLEVA